MCNARYGRRAAAARSVPLRLMSESQRLRKAGLSWLGGLG